MNFRNRNEESQSIMNVPALGRGITACTATSLVQKASLVGCRSSILPDKLFLRRGNDGVCKERSSPFNWGFFRVVYLGIIVQSNLLSNFRSSRAERREQRDNWGELGKDQIQQLSLSD